MTKEQEELYRWFDEELSCNFHMLVTRMNKFFKSNVCIPKGNTRHRYADVLHDYAEGIECEMKSSDNNTWLPLIYSESFEYRIKPSEPIYEWQWYSVIDGCVDDTTDTWESKQWLTEKEMIAWGNHWHKFEETKRIRQ